LATSLTAASPSDFGCAFDQATASATSPG
jgi:hypothetical protein